MKAKKRTITLLDIARETGVSASTVSRVLSGNFPVATETQAIVREAVERLGYRPNLNARGLVNGMSMVIGVLTQDISSPFFGVMLVGIERGLEGSGYTPMIIPGSWHIDKESHALDVLLERQVDALILLSGDIPDERIRTLEEELPLIVIGRNVLGIESCCIHLDHFQAAYSATQHLIQLGHKKIGHITGTLTQYDAVLRRDGYIQALIDAGLEPDPRLLLEGQFTEQAGIVAIETLLTRGAPFTAIFAGNDQIADGVLVALSRHGLRVPRDVSVIGFDDQPGSAYTVPPLTTVRQPCYDMGFASAKAILSMLAHEKFTIPTLSTELIVRDSTARIVGS